MLNPAVAQKLQIFALCLGGLLLAVFLGTQIGESKYAPLLLGTLIIVVASVSIFSGGFFWVLTIALITKIVPATIYTIYPFYSAVSTASLEELVTGDIDVTGRVGAFGNFGFILITLVLASVALPRILHPSNFFRLVAFVVGICS